MSDLGKNLDINPSFGAAKSSGINPAKKIDVDSVNNPVNSPSNSQIIIENKSVYKNPSISQDQLGYEAQERLANQLPVPIKKNNLTKSNSLEKKTDLPKDYEIKAKNPVLAAQLQNPKSKLPNKQKQKKAPPEPSLQVQYNPRKGIAINPRKVKPSIPGRLQSFVDDAQKPLDKLIHALDEDDSYDINLANIYAKKLLNDDALNQSISVSELLNLDEDLIELSQKDLIRQLKDLLEDLPNNSDSKIIIVSILQSLEGRQDPNILPYLLQMFLPIPFPFVFADIDEEFLGDEEELKKEFKEKDHNPDDGNEDAEEDDDEDVQYPDCVCSLSVKTKNYNKIHFYIKQNTKTNCVKVLIKGDSSASELVIPIESEIEDILFDRVDSINYDVSTWKDSILRISEQKVLKSNFKGKLNPVMLKICNSILRGINNNDINLNDDNMEMI